MDITLILLAFVALAAGIFAWQIYARKKRRKELQAWAYSQNLEFYPESDNTLRSHFPEYSCLSQGHSGHHAFNRSKGEWKGCNFLGFDYHYITRSRDSKGRSRSHHHYFSAVILSSPIPLKPLFLRPEGFFDKIKEFFGADDIDFESTEFSKRFFVKSPDRRWAYDVIHQRTIELLLKMPNFSIQFGKKHAIACRNSTFSTQDFENAADLLQGVFERFPTYLMKQQQNQN